MSKADMLAIGDDTAQLSVINWHHTLGLLIHSIGHPHFWERLVNALADCVPLDNWVAMKFARDRAPLVLGISDAPDDLRQRFDVYLTTAFQIDPFYLALRSSEALRHSSFLTLAEIAPDQFTKTDYYQTYFQLNVLTDEVQFILPAENAGWVSLSLGCAQKYTPAHLGLLRLVMPWVLALIGKHVAEIPPETRSDKAGEAPVMPLVPALGQALTAREQEVMYLILSGHSAKMTGRKLGISEETVKVHRRNIYRKFNVSTHSQLFSIFVVQSESARK